MRVFRGLTFRFNFCLAPRLAPQKWKFRRIVAVSSTKTLPAHRSLGREFRPWIRPKSRSIWILCAVSDVCVFDRKNGVHIVEFRLGFGYPHIFECVLFWTAFSRFLGRFLNILTFVNVCVWKKFCAFLNVRTFSNVCAFERIFAHFWMSVHFRMFFFERIFVHFWMPSHFRMCRYFAFLNVRTLVSHIF